MLYTNIIQNPVYAFLTMFTPRTWVRHHNKISLPYKTSSNSIQIEDDAKSQIQLPIGRSECSTLASAPPGETIQFFIDAAPEDHLLVEELTHYLEEHDYKNYLLPIDSTSGKYSDVLTRLENNLLKCNVVILPFGEKSPESWLRNHLRFYRKVYAKQTTHLRIRIYLPDSRRIPTDLDFSNLPPVSLCATSETCMELSNVKS